MASPGDKTRGQLTCAVDVFPEVVDAGAEITLHGIVLCAPGCDLRGQTVLIKDETGADRGSMALTGFDGERNETDEFVVRAPVKPDGYMWRAVCPAIVKKGVSYAEASAPISFTVVPHTTTVVVWDVPSAVEVGERFGIKVGIKCSSGCHLTNRAFEVHDHKERSAATRTLSGDQWPGTSLYFVEVDLEAPSGEGLYTWSVECARTDAGLPHAEGGISFGIRAVNRAEHVMTVETVDKETQTPLGGARVVMHPYRAVTDEHGVAKVRVAKGAYKLFVSQTGYLTFDLPVDVTSDMTVRTELELEPLPERN